MAAEVADLVIKVTRTGVTEATAELHGLGNAAEGSGQEAFKASIEWDGLQKMMQASGEVAARSAIDYITQGKAMNYASDQADQLSRSMVKAGLMRGAGVGGGPPGAGFATDLGSAFRFASNAAQGFLTVATLISPTVNLIISAVIGIASPLIAATAAAVGLGAAIGAVSIGMVAVSLKWRSLLSDTTDGVDHVRGAVLAVEAELFKASQGAIKAFGSAGGGQNPFDTFAKVTITAIKMVEPYINDIASWIGNFVHRLGQIPGYISPVAQWFRTWIDEWKTLGQIINEGIKSGGGFIAFLQKYEAPAKAFVEGIARVINALRKGMQMGLGLNMDQLTEFINNLFEAISKVVPGWLRFSNALTQVGLNVSRLLNTMAPIVSQMFTIGAAILQHLVAPLVDGLLKALDAVMKVPFLRWIVELGGGLAVAAFGISKLTFGILTTAQVLRGKAIGAMAGFVAETIKLRGAGTWVEVLATQFPRLTGFIQKAWGAAQSLGSALSGGKLEGTKAGILGTTVAAAGLTAAVVFVDSAMQAWGQTQADITAGMQALTEKMNEGAISIDDAKTAMVQLGFAGLQNQSWLSEAGQNITHFGTALKEELGRDIPGLSNLFPSFSEANNNMQAAIKMTEEQVKASMDAMVGNMQDGIAQTGALTDEQVRYAQWLKGQGASGQEEWNKLLTDANTMYQNNTISTAQYVQILTQLGVTQTDLGNTFNLAHEKMIGATNTLAQSLNEMNTSLDGGNKLLTNFATNLGQSSQQMTQDAMSAINDIQGGILGTGEKITEFFQTQKQAIQDWKNTYAENINLVNQSFSTLGQQAKLTGQQLVKGLDDALKALQNFHADQKRVLSKNILSDAVLKQVYSLDPASQATIFNAFTQLSDKELRHVNKVVRQGGDITQAMANAAADSINLTFDKLLSAIELLVSDKLGLSFNQVKNRVNRLVGDTNKATGRIKDRKVNIDFQFATAHMQRTKQAMLGDTGAARSALQGLLPSQAEVKSAAQQVGQAAGQGYTDGFQSQEAAMTKATSDLGNKAVEGFSKGAAPQKMQKVGSDAVRSAASGITSATPGLVSGMVQAGTNMGAGFRLGLNTQMQQARTDAVNTANQIAQDLRNATQQHSPSKVFYDIGSGMGEGMRLGWSDSMEYMTRDVRTKAKKLQEGWGYSGGKRRRHIEGTLDFDWKSGVANLAGAEAWSQRNAV